MITMYGAMAQSESESISGNVKWAKTCDGSREGLHRIQNLYAYEKGADGKPAPIPAQAEIVRELYTRYLAGASLRELKDWLEHGKQPTVAGGTAWSITAVKGILTNENTAAMCCCKRRSAQTLSARKWSKTLDSFPNT